MKIFISIIFILLTQLSFAQSIKIEDFDTIVMKQQRKIGLSLDGYYFVDNKIPFYSISGGTPNKDGGIHLTAQSFRNKQTKEILEISIKEKDTIKNIITIEIRYTAPKVIIEKMEKDFLERGYKYKKKKKYFVKRKSRKEQNVITIRDHCLYVSEFDEQPEIVFTTDKKLK